MKGCGFLRLCILYVFIFFLGNLEAQDPVFSQFYNAPLQINPAMAGNNIAPLVSVNYRMQWPGINSAYSTFAAGYDQFFSANQIGLGLSLLADSAGDGALKSTKGTGSLSYRLKVGNERFLKGGLEIGFVQKRLNWDKLLFYDAIDPQSGGYTPGGSPLPSSEIEPGNTSRSYVDITSGLLLYDKKFFLGIALSHLNTPSDNFLQSSLQNYNDLPLRYTFHGGLQVPLGNKLSKNTFLSPNLLITGQAGFTQVNAGAYISKEAIFGGVWYRHSGKNTDAVILSAGVRVGAVKIGYSFDYTVSSLSIASGGAHELGIVFDLKEYFPEESKINDCLMLFR